MIYNNHPVDFKPVKIAVCIIEHNNQILLLKRAANELHPGVWSLPSGTIEEDENPEQAICREIIEECGFSLTNPIYLITVYIRHAEYDYTNYLFKQVMNTKPNILLDLEENEEYGWFTRTEVETLDKEDQLIFDELGCIELVYKSLEFGVDPSTN